jgi:excisionase family DNA binding protein
MTLLPDAIGCSPELACEYLGIDRQTLWKYLTSGYVTAYGRGTRSVRFHTASLQEWIWWQTSEWPEKRNPYEFVYLIVCMKVYKIGLASNVAKRIASIQTSCPGPIELVHTIPTNDAHRAEGFLHRLFKMRRSHGEWFKLTPTDVRFICQCQALLF